MDVVRVMQGVSAETMFNLKEPTLYCKCWLHAKNTTWTATIRADSKRSSHTIKTLTPNHEYEASPSMHNAKGVRGHATIKNMAHVVGTRSWRWRLLPRVLTGLTQAELQWGRQRAEEQAGRWKTGRDGTANAPSIREPQVRFWLERHYPRQMGKQRQRGRIWGIWGRK